MICHIDRFHSHLLLTRIIGTHLKFVPLLHRHPLEVIIMRQSRYWALELKVVSIETSSRRLVESAISMLGQVLVAAAAQLPAQPIKKLHSTHFGLFLRLLRNYLDYIQFIPRFLSLVTRYLQL